MRRRRRRPTITDHSIPANVDVLLTEGEVQARIDDLAARLAPRLSNGEWTGVVVLLGATPFAADLLRAFSRLGLDLGFDAIWLQSYADARESSGRMQVHADVARPVEGRNILLIDDVFDSGKTIAFARKPDAAVEGLDAWAWDAPPRFLVGYGMDDAGMMRGLPFVGAMK
jgi:hypoxanthine phosphoribosyltransferase